MNDFCIVHKLGDDDRIAAALRGDISPLIGETLVVTRLITIPPNAPKYALYKCTFIVKSIDPNLKNNWIKQELPFPKHEVLYGCSASVE